MLPNPYAKHARPESLTFTVTRRLLWCLLVLIVAYGAPTAVASLTRPPPPRMPAPYALEVPPLDWTTDGSTLVLDDAQRFVSRKLPAPDADRQLRPPCRKDLGQEAINGYCWQRLPVAPPCPKPESAEHEGQCYFPLLRAERPKVPSSGGALPVSVAGEAE